MATPEVKSAGASIRESAISTIVLGFAADPMARWAWPESSEYLRMMPQFVNAIGGRAFEHRTADITEAARAAALWLPPGVEPDEAEMGAVMEQSLRPEIAADIGAVMKGMAELDRARARHVADETRPSAMRRGGRRGLPRKLEPA